MAGGSRAASTILRSRPQSVATRSTRDAIITGVLLVLSTAYALNAFANFSPGRILAVALVFVSVPVGVLIADFRTSKDVPEHAGARSIAGSAVAAAVLWLHQIGGLVSVKSYFANFAYLRLHVGGGYHPDTAFHVAIIQNIRNTGRPSTGQHLDPTLSYHVLSHYADAAITRVLRLDPWDSYALLFHMKSLLMLLLLVRLASVLTRHLAPAWFWVVLVFLVAALTSDWHVVYSHGHWVPMALLFGFGPSIHRVMIRSEIGSSGWAGLTVVLVLLSFGKVSLGVGFAIAVGAWTVCYHGVTWGGSLTGAFWATFLAAWGLRIGDSRAGAMSALAYPPEGLVNRLTFAGGTLFAYIGFVIVLIIVARIFSDRHAWRAVAASVMSLTVVVAVALFATRGASEAFYFFNGLAAVIIVLFLPFILGSFHLRAGDGTRQVSTPRPRLTLAVGLALLLAVSPLAVEAPFSPYVPVADLVVRARDANVVTFEWHNASVPLDQQRTVMTGPRRDAFELETVAIPSFFASLRDGVDILVTGSGESRVDVLLFFAREDFEFIAERFNLPQSWSNGLLVTAVTGLPLLFGVDASSPLEYGFSPYDSEALRRSRDEVTVEDLCAFGRPVIVIGDLDDLALTMLCIKSIAGDSTGVTGSAGP